MKTALVTGCDHGLGLALAEALVKRDYLVLACHYADEPGLKDLRAAFPGRVLTFPLDIGSDASVAALRQAVEAAVPSVDLLINCAGILGDMAKTIGDELDFDEMLRVYNVNALGALRVTNALCRLVAQSGEKLIVNISSEAGSIQSCWRTGWFAYCMSKAANNMQGALTQNALRDQGVRVIQMHPGHVATFMRGHLDTTAKLTPAQSAEGILRTVLDTPLPASPRPPFVDYRGETQLY